MPVDEKVLAATANLVNGGRGADITVGGAAGLSPLSCAAWGGNVAVVKMLLDRRADTASKDDAGRTPLAWAARNGEMAVVKLLLANGADPSAKDIHGNKPEYWAGEGETARLQSYSVIRRVL